MNVYAMIDGDKIKAATDLNLKFLAEQRIEVRHCETLAVAVIVITMTIYGWIIQNTNLIGIVGFALSGNKLSYLNMIDKIHLFVYFCSVFVISSFCAIISGVLRRKIIRSEKLTEEICGKLMYWNQISEDLIVETYKGEPKSFGAFSAIMLFPSMLFFAGFAGMAVLLVIQFFVTF